MANAPRPHSFPFITSRARRGQPFFAYTHGFDRFPDIDERPLLVDFVREYGIQWRPFTADAYMLLTNPDLRPVDLCTLVSTTWREIKTRCYQSVQADGVTVMLSGHFGDHLYASSRYWFEDELRSGNIGAVASESVTRAKRIPLCWRDPAWRHVGKRILGLPTKNHTPPVLADGRCSK